VEILAVAPNWLGDVVMALPALRDLRAHFTGHTFSVAARPSVAPVFRMVRGVDRIFVLDRGKETVQLSGDVGVLFPNSFRSAWLLKRAGVRERWGYRSDFRGPLLTRAIRRPKGKVSFPHYYSNLVRQLGVETGPLTAKLELPPSVIATGQKLLDQRGWEPGQPLIGIAPGAAFGHAKRWPARRFQELANLLKSELGATAVVLGRIEDRDAARGIDGIDLIGQTDLPGLMGVIAQCRALVANDSGALHLGAALGVPVVGIYGPTDERYSTPLASSEGGPQATTLSEPVFCRPCFLADCPIDHRCMKRISTGRVFDAVRHLLQASHP
jgi:heptosyltransferase-2